MATTWRPTDTFSARLFLTRREKKMSVEVAARTVGVSTATWSYWERGGTPRDMGQQVRRIADALEVDRDWLMWGGPLAEPGSGTPTSGYLPDSRWIVDSLDCAPALVA
jgi:transcriptional regulator with XRE-family HTH domain